MILSIAIFILMQTDYILTIVGNRLKNKKYSEYFVFDSYELNPLHKKNMEKNKVFNFWYIFASVFLSLAVYTVTVYGRENLAEFMAGGLLIHYTILISRHLSNIITFSVFKRKNSLVEGRIRLSGKYLLLISRLNYMSFAVVLAVISIFSFSYFVLGGLVMSILMFFAHFLWELAGSKSG